MYHSFSALCICLAVSLPDLWTTVSFVVMIFFQEVESKYNELRQTHSDPATDSDDNNGVFFTYLSHECAFSFVHLQRISNALCDIFQMEFSDERLPALSVVWAKFHVTPRWLSPGWILDHLTLVSPNNGDLMSDLPLQACVMISYWKVPL